MAENAPRPPRPKKRDVSGWLILDKPVGMTSTHAVAVAKRLMNARKAGHAGTLDPLASGLLPIAFGEATKTVPFVMDGEKAYRFEVTWGEERDTDDAEGRAVATSEARPDRAAIEALIPSFTGVILQTPPKFSAIKIAGERAYDLARDGEVVELAPRPVEIRSLRLVEHEPSRSVFEATCGKGTYVRAIARDMGRALGCLGHVSALRRTRVGPFDEASSATLEAVEAAIAAQGPGTPPETGTLRPVIQALGDLAQISVSRSDAARLRRGQAILLRGRDAPVMDETVCVTCFGELVALADVAQGEAHPTRVFNLQG
jgi:tRNA pseudouridine55 synthase